VLLIIKLLLYIFLLYIRWRWLHSSLLLISYFQSFLPFSNLKLYIINVIFIINISLGFLDYLNFLRAFCLLLINFLFEVISFHNKFSKLKEFLLYSLLFSFSVKFLFLNNYILKIFWFKLLLIL